MIYSNSTKYAIMALMRLAAEESAKPVTVKSLADATGVSAQFLAKIVQSLVREGIVSSTRGRGGGIAFAKPPAQISLMAIVRAVDGPRALSDCIFGLNPCSEGRNCPIRCTWGPIRNQIFDFLQGTSIADLASLLKEDDS